MINLAIVTRGKNSEHRSESLPLVTWIVFFARTWKTAVI